MAKRGARWRRAGAALALLAITSCAAPATGRAGRSGRSVLGAEIGDLGALEPGWRRIRRDDAALAYEHVDGTAASWLRDCRGVEAPPRALARALWIAIPEGEVQEERGLEVAGAPGWRMRGHARAGARVVQVESVTRVTPRCEDSFLLVEPHGELHHAATFEAWWRGLRDSRGGK